MVNRRPGLHREALPCPQSQPGTGSSLPAINPPSCTGVGSKTASLQGPPAACGTSCHCASSSRGPPRAPQALGQTPSCFFCPSSTLSTGTTRATPTVLASSLSVGRPRTREGECCALDPPPGLSQLAATPQHPRTQNSGTAGHGHWADQSCGALTFRVWPEVRALGALYGLLVLQGGLLRGAGPQPEGLALWLRQGETLKAERGQPSLSHCHCVPGSLLGASHSEALPIRVWPLRQFCGVSFFGLDREESKFQDERVLQLVGTEVSKRIFHDY